jgi:hypothetical protein
MRHRATEDSLLWSKNGGNPLGVLKKAIVPEFGFDFSFSVVAFIQIDIKDFIQAL